MTQMTNGAAISTAERGRRYDVDALRVFAFGLLILYHVGMFYVADWGWHVKSNYEFEWLQVPMSFTSQWRMSLLFVISGLAISFIWGKYSAGGFALRRIWRLLIPLLFGMAFIVAPQCYYEALNKGIIEPGFLRFMGQYLTFQDFPGEAWGGENQIHWTWNHLWYLAYLLMYTLALIPIAMFIDGRGQFIRETFRSLRGIWIIVVPIIPLMAYFNLIFPSFPGINHTLVYDWYGHAMFFTFFLYGFLIGRDPGFWDELSRLRKATLGAAIVFYLIMLAARALVPEDAPAWQEQFGALVIYLNRWTWMITIFGWGYYLLNRPMKWLPYATEAVYPWYILHQTITIVVGYNLTKLELGPVIEPMLVLLATIAGCFVLHEYVIRRSRFLRPLFGLKQPARIDSRRPASRKPA